MKMHLVALAATVALVACGGGGGDAGTPSDPSSAPPPPPLTVIQLFGDSTMNMVAPLVAAQYPNRISDRAKDGSTSTQLIAGTDTVNQPWPMSVTGTYAVVNHGLNDGWRGNQVLTQDQYRANLEVLASAPGAQVIFQTPLPSVAPGRDMTAYAQTMREVAAEHGLLVIDVFSCYQQQPDWQQRFADGTHPDAQGLQAMFACMKPTLDVLR